MRIGFVGAGLVGQTLARGLAEKGYQVAVVASRTYTSAVALADRIPGCRAVKTAQTVVDETDLVFLTVPDDAIGAVAASVSWRPGMAVVHCSGAMSLDVLSPAAKKAARVGSFHPLQTFADADEALRSLPGSTFAIEGDGPLDSTLEEMARTLGGRPIRLPPGSKTLYHASAVLACNYLVTLVQRATDLWETFGVPPDEALSALLPLLRGTVASLGRVGLPGALTGPIARGDVGTVQRHLEVLARTAPALVDVYCQLGMQTIPIAMARGSLAKGPAEQLQRLFSTGSRMREDQICA